MYKVVTASEATIRQITANKVAINYITKDFSPGLSLATTEAVAYYERETTAYNRIYYVLEGQMVLAFDGVEVELKAGDACYIGKGTTYEMRGTFNAITVNQPAFGV